MKSKHFKLFEYKSGFKYFFKISVKKRRRKTTVGNIFLMQSKTFYKLFLEREKKLKVTASELNLGKLLKSK